MASVEILLAETIGQINPNLYGHFAEHLGGCIYDGLWQNGTVCGDLVSALKRIHPPVIRWPGGCFADDYHWRDGIGPASARPRRVNIHWGNTIEPNTFGTHEFLAFCRTVGAAPYLCGNVGSGSPQEMRDWVEYCNYPGGSTLSDERKANGSAEPFRVRYWGVGNENWGCGGHFTPEDYASEYRRFSTYLRDFTDAPLFLIACGPDSNDLDWTGRFFEHVHKSYRKYCRIHGYAAHYYCGTAGTATQYTEGQWYELLLKAINIETLIVQQRAMLDRYDPQRNIGLIIDEWGTWHPPTPGRNPAFLWQQSTLRDGLVAALTLDTFNRHADKLHMSNIAQLVNVLQSLFLVEDGKVVLTPTYHVYDLYKNHQGARSLRVICDAPDITFNIGGMLQRMPGLAGSASIKGNTLTLTIVNPRLGEPLPATLKLRGPASAILVRQTILTHGDMHVHNTFDSPANITLSEPRILPLSGQTLDYTFAPQSVTRLEMSLA